MRRYLGFGCHVLVLLLAWRYCHSASGFLLNGPAAALLLDRFLFRVLPWQADVFRKRELAGCLTAFLLGTVVFYLLRPGIVPWWEAVYRGAMVSVSVFLCEVLVGLAARHRLRWRVGLRLVLVGLIVLLIPVAAGLHPLHTVPKRTPAVLGLAFEDIRFRTADGLLLAAWLMPHPEARGNVILCHGHGRNRGHLATLFLTLNRLRLNVMAIDFRGHGDSEGHTSTFGKVEVRDLVAAAEFVRGRFADQPLFLVGVSLGAAVSLQALPLLPDVCGVWSEGAFGRLDRVVDNEFACLPSCLRKLLVAGYEILGRLDCGLLVRSVNPVESLRGVSAPIFFCHGQRDELVPWEEGESLYESCRGPRWCWWVANASHYRVRQANHDEYLRRLRAFLDERLNSRPQ
jgi:alpha-beta hydrolase superfamily lysophospholipase